MKNMFLSSSFADVAELFVQFSQGQYSGQTVTFIPTASIPEKVKFYVAAGKKALHNLGFVVDELEISSATPEQIRHKLQTNNAIYVSGGNTFFLLQELKRTGADEIISQQVNAGKMYIGESAGAIVVSASIEYVKSMDNARAAPTLNSLSGLKLVDFYPVPHHTNPPFKKTVENIISKYKETLSLCPISNAQAIAVNGNEYEVLGG